MILWGAFAPRYFPYCGIPADDVLSNFTTGFFVAPQERQIPFLPHHQWGLRGCGRPMTHFHIWWLITKPPVFHHKKTTLSSSPYQKIYHEIVLFNGFVLFLCWPIFLNIKNMLHRLNHLGVGCLGFKGDPKVWFPALKELLRTVIKMFMENKRWWKWRWWDLPTRKNMNCQAILNLDLKL